MASNKTFNFGPVTLVNSTTTNILFPGFGAHATAAIGFTDTALYIILRHIRIVNRTAASATFSLYKGALATNAAGTEVIGIGISIPANGTYDWNGIMRLDALSATTDALVGGSNTLNALTIQGEGEIGVSG
jgi:hypothetical protein